MVVLVVVVVTVFLFFLFFGLFLQIKITSNDEAIEFSRFESLWSEVLLSMSS